VFWATSKSIDSGSVKTMVKFNTVLILIITLVLHAGQADMVKQWNETTMSIIGLGKFVTAKVKVTGNSRSGFLLFH
jgi:hypothetical protein